MVYPKLFKLRFYGDGNAFSYKPNTSFRFDINTKDGNTRFIFEVPMSTTKQIIADTHDINYEHMNRIVLCISHLHEDHVGGLSTLLAWLKYVKNISIKKQVDIICPDIADMTQYLKLTYSPSIKEFPRIAEGQFVYLNSTGPKPNHINITTVEVNHCDGILSCGFDVSWINGDKRERFYYTGDCVEIPEDVVEAVNTYGGIDFVVGEISEYPISDENVHCSYEFYNKNFDADTIHNRIMFVHNDFDYYKLLKK